MLEIFKHFGEKEFVSLLVDWIIQHGGIYLLMFIIFAETGLFAGFFLPGDSLLFVAGIYATQFGESFFGAHYLIVMFVISIAAVIGNIVGYWFGKQGGPLLYTRKDSFFFKKKYLKTAQKFFNENGSTAIILGRFVPIVRTFAPIVAGIVQVDYKKFGKDSIIGAFAWVFSMMLAGKFLQTLIWDKFQIDLKHHIEKIALGIIIVTTAPVIYKFIKETRKAKHEEEQEAI
jgi:membrane-associated protein